MEQHPIPQDITGFQFKLVGDMTLRQFGFLASGLILGWVFYSTPWYPIVKFPIAGLFAFLGVAFAFIPIEDRPLDVWVVNFFKAIYKPTYLVWQKDGGDSELSSPILSVKAPSPTGFQLPQLWPIPKPNLNSPNKTQPTEDKTDTKTPQTTLEDIPLAAQQPIIQTTEVPNTTPVSENIPTITPPQKTVSNTQVPVSTQTSPPLMSTPKPDEQATENQTRPTSGRILSIDELERLRNEKLQELSALAANTPTPKPEEQSYEYGSPEPVKMDISKLEAMRETALAPKDPQTQKTIDQYEEKMRELIFDNNQLTTRIDETREEMKKLAGQDVSLFEKQINEFSQSKDQISKKIDELQKALNQLRLTPPPEPEKPKFVPPAQIRVVPRLGSATQTLSLSDIPNVISGLIKNEKGEPLASVIVIIKDSAGSPIRALKSNKIGQFITNTPLNNGKYFLEMEKEGWKFDSLELTLSGNIIPLIEIIGKENGPV